MEHGGMRWELRGRMGGMGCDAMMRGVAGGWPGRCPPAVRQAPAPSSLPGPLTCSAPAAPAAPTPHPRRARLGLPPTGGPWPGPAPPDPARLGSARLGSARLGPTLRRGPGSAAACFHINTAGGVTGRGRDREPPTGTAPGPGPHHWPTVPAPAPLGPGPHPRPGSIPRPLRDPRAGLGNPLHT